MENVDVPMFDDPQLKDALRRHYSCKDCCPAHLRSRIAEALSLPASPHLAAASVEPLTKPVEAGSTPVQTPIRWWRSSGPSLAIAASMLLAIGTVTLILSRSAHALPANLQAAACSRHDSCTQHKLHRTDDIPQDFHLVGQYLRTQLKHPVLAANLSKEHWLLRGAAICPVGEAKSAHLLYDQGDRTLSVFSLPASAFPALQDQKTYEGTTEGHAVIARREGDAVYCLVCCDPTGTLKIDGLREMLRQHEGEAAVAMRPVKRSRTLQLALSVAREN